MTRAAGLSDFYMFTYGFNPRSPIMAAAGFKVASDFLAQLKATREAGKGGGGSPSTSTGNKKSKKKKRKVTRHGTGKGTGPQGLMPK